MTSKNKINERMKTKTDSYLARAIYLAKKTNQIDLAEAISVSSRKQASVNLNELNNIKVKSVIIPGKVLSSGDLKQKINIYALAASEKAREKIKKSGSEFKTILSALEKGEKINGELIK